MGVLRTFVSLAVLSIAATQLAHADPTPFHPSASLRLRSQLETFDDAPERYRLRLRGRLGATYDAGPGLDIGGRLSTGSEDPTSSQLTLGHELDKQPLKLDQLFARLRRGKWLELMIGKLPAPFRNRRLIWDRDVSPEGASEALRFGCPRGIEAHVTLGQFMLVEVEEAVDDPVALVAQGGVAIERSPIEVRLDVALHDYRNVTGVVFTYGHGSNTVDADGGLAGRYRLADALLEVSARTRYARLGSYLELSRNVRNAKAGDALAVGFEAETHQIRIGYEFRRVERDAILDVLAETAWYVERTNFRGHKVGAKRSFAGGWTVGSSLAIMRSLDRVANRHIDWSIDAEWAL